MKIKEIVQRVESMMARGVSTSLMSSYISRPWIYNMLVTYRSKLVGQKINKKQRISQWNKQTLSCVTLVDVDASECPCDHSGCLVRRTAERLPEFMLGLSDYAIDGIYTNDRKVKINLMGMNGAMYNRHSRYASKLPYAYLHDGYLFLVNCGDWYSATIVGLFEDPIEAHKWWLDNNACGSDETTCSFDYMEFDFPIDTDMTDTIVMLCANELSMVFQRQPQQKADEDNGNERRSEDE
ncbi:MAG: hypothetical protein II063_10340 [Prevotella sp.]|nr:hypothetical protein [Prevotella sp.]